MIPVLGKELSGVKDREALEQPGKKEEFLPRKDTGEASGRRLKAALVPPALCRRWHHRSISPRKMAKSPTIFMSFPKPKGLICVTTET